AVEVYPAVTSRMADEWQFKLRETTATIRGVYRAECQAALFPDTGRSDPAPRVELLRGKRDRRRPTKFTSTTPVSPESLPALDRNTDEHDLSRPSGPFPTSSARLSSPARRATPSPSCARRRGRRRA